MEASFVGHKFGVSNVEFTHNSHYVISVSMEVSSLIFTNPLLHQVGAEHDMTVNVWDWRNNKRLASNKISFHVKSISIGPDGSHFVAAGNRLIWC